jgi:hypothetical protein
MTPRKTYHITKTEEGWKGQLEGGKKASATASTKQEVIKKTIEIAKNQDISSIKIHKKDGTIQEERTYPRKSDPHPPKG